VGCESGELDAGAGAGDGMLSMDLKVQFSGDDLQGFIDGMGVDWVQLAGAIGLHFDAGVSFQQVQDGVFKADGGAGGEKGGGGC